MSTSGRYKYRVYQFFDRKAMPQFLLFTFVLNRCLQLMQLPLVKFPKNECKDLFLTRLNRLFSAKMPGKRSKCSRRFLILSRVHSLARIRKRPDRTTKEETTREDDSLNFAKTGSKRCRWLRPASKYCKVLLTIYPYLALWRLHPCSW